MLTRGGGSAALDGLGMVGSRGLHGEDHQLRQTSQRAEEEEEEEEGQPLLDGEKTVHWGGNEESSRSTADQCDGVEQ